MEKALSGTVIAAGSEASADEERVWIQASQRGEAAAFNHLVIQWEQAIYNLCLRMLGNADEAAEVCQESFLAAFKNIRRFRRDARFSTWLYRIASNRCLTRLKRRPREQHFSLESESLGLPSRDRLSGAQHQEELVLRRERRERVGHALQKLSPDQRAVVVLKIYREQKFEEIAAALNAPVSTVKSRFYSSLEVLKRQLGHLSPSL